MLVIGYTRNRNKTQQNKNLTLRLFSSVGTGSDRMGEPDKYKSASTNLAESKTCAMAHFLKISTNQFGVMVNKLTQNPEDLSSRSVQKVGG